MAVTRQTLAELMRQRAAIDAIVDTRTRDLIVAWARAWDELQAELVAAIERVMAGNAPLHVRVAAIRAAQAQRVAVAALTQLSRYSRDMITADALVLINRAAPDQLRLIGLQLPLEYHSALGVDWVRTNPDQIAEIVQRTTEQITSRTWQLQAEATVQMERELIRAVGMGDNPRDAARAMVRAVQGVFEGGLTRAMVIARTELISAYREAAQIEQARHAKILKGWQWVADLSSPRTCRSCLAMHGSVHPLDEPGPLDHQQGRCSRVPVTVSWKDLGIDAPEPGGRAREGDGERWLRGQPERVQRNILGDRGFEAWRNGDWPASEWTTRRETDGWRDSYGPARMPQAS